jgi:hypothetical protein
MLNSLVVFFILIASVWAQVTAESSQDEMSHVFSGRISRINQHGRLVRLRTDAGNVKFLNRRDRIEFWNETFPEQRCSATIEDRSNDYLLLRVPDFEVCIRRVRFTTGTYLHLESADLKRSLGMARDLFEILQKKRLAMQAKKIRHQRDLDAHLEKVEITN